MKDKIARTLIYLLLGLLACHIKMLGCYPFVAVIFGACYLNEENRRLCVPFSYLWMVLFLPIAALFRYGVTFLVWMVVLAIFWHMHILVRRMGQTSLLGMILVAITYGGRVMTATQTMTFPYGILPVLEGLLVAGGAYFTCRGMDLLEEVWHSMQKKTGTRVLPLQAREYSRAMSGLAQSMEALVRPREGEAGMGFVAMQQELRGRICGDCGHYETCLAQGSAMSLAMEQLFAQAEKGQKIDPVLQEKIGRQCERAELLIREALGIFERTELNLAWYRRLCEHREMIAGQIDAMAYVMEDCMEADRLCDDKERWLLAKIRFRLREVGLRVWNLHFYRRKNGTCRILMELAARAGVCMTSKEVLAIIETCTGQTLMMVEQNRSIVGRERADYVFVTRPKLECTYGVAKMLQRGQTISGDSFGTRRLERGAFVMALSDGMGSGRQAHEESDTVISLFLQFAEAGFTIDMALRLMNAAMIFGAEAERYSTLDACLVDEYTGIVDCYKVGAHVSFVRHKRRTEVIEADSLPMGASASLEALPSRSYLEAGDYLVLVTDGVLEYLQVEDAVEMLRQLIEELADTDAVTFARKIIERVLLFTGGTAADDMTVLVLKALER